MKTGKLTFLMTDFIAFMFFMVAIGLLIDSVYTFIIRTFKRIQRFILKRLGRWSKEKEFRYIHGWWNAGIDN